jgi:hypothetical protein
MLAAIVLVGILLGALIALALVGVRSRTIFTNPGVLSDAQIASTIGLTRKIMDRTPPGSPTWARAAAKHKAAIDEQLRRRGEAPLDDIELVGPK